MRQFTNTIEINVKKDQVWDLLYNRFGEAVVYNPMVDASHTIETSGSGTGSERKCNFDPNGKNAVCERITETRGEESFDIEIFDGGLPMMDKMNATVKLTELGDRTSTAFTISYTTKPAFMGGMMKMPMKKKMMSVLVGLKYHLETGELVDKDNIKSIMREYKSLSSTQKFAPVSQELGFSPAA
jgi:hypothetical protein